MTTVVCHFSSLLLGACGLFGCLFGWVYTIQKLTVCGNRRLSHKILTLCYQFFVPFVRLTSHYRAADRKWQPTVVRPNTDPVLSVLYPIYSSLRTVREFNGCRADDLIPLFGLTFHHRTCWWIYTKCGIGGLDKYLFFLSLSVSCSPNRFTIVAYLLTPWSRVPLEKLTSKLCS